MRRLVALVPAAGLSTRFGEANKLLQPYGVSTVVGTVVATLLSAGLPVVVVTGHDAEAVREACPGAEFVFNPRFREGLGSSIAAGVRAVDADGVLIVLGDQPGLGNDVVHAMRGAFEVAPPGAILAIRYANEPDRPGHPIVYEAAHFSALAALGGDVGAKDYLRSRSDSILWIHLPGRLRDLDVPTDFEP